MSVYGFEECVILLHTVLHIYPSVNMIVMCGASSLFMLGLFLIAILCLSLWLVGVCGRGVLWEGSDGYVWRCAVWVGALCICGAHAFVPFTMC